MTDRSLPQEPSDEDLYEPEPGELEDAAGEAAPGAPGAGEEAVPEDDRDALLADYESRYMRKGAIFLIVASVGFMVGLWFIQDTMFSAPDAGPPLNRNVTTELLFLHSAMNGQGIMTFESGNLRELALWLTERAGPHARVPDLRAAGLVASGVRLLNLRGGGWGMIRYRSTGGGPDLIAVFAPPGRMGVPEKAVARMADGTEVWLQEERSVLLLYAPGDGVDWALVSARGEPGMLEAAGALAGKG